MKTSILFFGTLLSLSSFAADELYAQITCGGSLDITAREQIFTVPTRGTLEVRLESTHVCVTGIALYHPPQGTVVCPHRDQRQHWQQCQQQQQQYGQGWQPQISLPMRYCGDSLAKLVEELMPEKGCQITGFNPRIQPNS